MPEDPAAAVETRSLAEIHAGDIASIEGFVFPLVESHCTERGLPRGEVVRCRSAGRSVLVLEAGDGHTVLVDSDWARFVRVDIHDDAA